MKKYTTKGIKIKFGYSVKTSIGDMKTSVLNKIKRVGHNSWIIKRNKHCSTCNYLKVISVPDWFKCKKYGYEASTQTDLKRKCLKDINLAAILNKPQKQRRFYRKEAGFISR